MAILKETAPNLTLIDTLRLNYVIVNHFKMKTRRPWGTD
jgi:hypothetical protein